MEVHSEERALGRDIEPGRLLRLALLPLGIAFGVAAEWSSYQGAADLVVGLVLIACGVAAWDRRPESRVGALMTLAGYTWFLGNLAEPLLFVHRGPLVHLVLSYPTGRLHGKAVRIVVAAAYIDGAIEPLARNDVLTLVLCAAVAVAGVWAFRGTSGPLRKARGLGLAATLTLAAVLALGAVARLDDRDLQVLGLYQLVVAGIAIVLCLDLLRGRWAEAVVTGLVVDLGAPDQAGTLRSKLARALGDPSLVIGYPLADGGGLVDDAGRPVQLPAPGTARSVTTIEGEGDRVAVLVHDEDVLADRKLFEAVASAARMAVVNARLQAEAREQAVELEASRRRIVEAGDTQRRRLEEELRFGAERRLEAVSTLLAEARDGDTLRDLMSDLEQARRELRELAQGIHPAALTGGGLMPALALLAERSPVAVEIEGEVGRLPEPIEAACFFVCSEALANVAKHARARQASIVLRDEGERIVVLIADDGVGGARASGGSGLSGLRDRVEALGGSLRLEASAGNGTQVVAELPTSEA
jgi:signal transduction histidine kinase